MFVEVITARVVDPELLGRQWTRWSAELEPGAAGFLGSTAGISDDGTFIAVVRFESADAAANNATRPEQTRWWVETVAALRDIELHDLAEPWSFAASKAVAVA